MSLLFLCTSHLLSAPHHSCFLFVISPQCLIYVLLLLLHRLIFYLNVFLFLLFDRWFMFWSSGLQRLDLLTSDHDTLVFARRERAAFLRTRRFSTSMEQTWNLKRFVKKTMEWFDESISQTTNTSVMMWESRGKHGRDVHTHTHICSGYHCWLSQGRACVRLCSDERRRKCLEAFMTVIFHWQTALSGHSQGRTRRSLQPCTCAHTAALICGWDGLLLSLRLASLGPSALPY